MSDIKATPADFERFTLEVVKQHPVLAQRLQVIILERRVAELEGVNEAE